MLSFCFDNIKDAIHAPSWRWIWRCH